ncbi:hypothetical protein C2S52_013662 [Perilla frutescens var. hirtella]|nr:hypothetical protein C2S51_015948 [Perilla frutescens var. frutescens]KAH6776101.1 hypothetical protein C2S52_013662 [Perilla frutescens var. hirtella]
MAVVIAWRFRFLGLVDGAESPFVSSGKVPHSDQFLVAVGFGKIRSDLTFTSLRTRDFGEARIIEARAFRPYAGVKNSDDDFTGRVRFWEQRGVLFQT